MREFSRELEREVDLVIEGKSTDRLRKSFDDDELDAETLQLGRLFDGLLDGPSALAFGGTSIVDVARTLVEWAKKVEDLDLKGAVLDGEYFDGEAGVKRLSTFPTREEAQAKVVSLVLAPAGNITGAAKAPGAKLLGIVKEIQERLEKGETIAKAG